MFQHKLRTPMIVHGVFRAVSFALLWWALIEGDPEGWTFGLPVIILATITSLMLLPPVQRPWRLRSIVRFIIFFLWQSLQGGTDVALRAINPRLPLRPALLDYPLRLPDGLAQIVLVDTISLLPGTLSANLYGTYIQVHVLDANPHVEQSLQQVEVRVADMFGIDLT